MLFFIVVVILFLHPILVVYYYRLLAWLQEKTLLVIECGVIAVRLAWRKFISWKLTPYTILFDYLIFWHVVTFLGTVIMALCKTKKSPYRPYSQVNQSQVIFRHGTQLPADNLTTRVVWTFSRRMTIRVNALGLSTSLKFASYDWLFLDPPWISDNGSELETTVTIRPVCGMTRSVSPHPLLA